MVSKPTEFLKAAASEYEAALDWYFERSPVAAEKFDAEVNRALENIAGNPQRWPTHSMGTRQGRLAVLGRHGDDYDRRRATRQYGPVGAQQADAGQRVG